MKRKGFVARRGLKEAGAKPLSDAQNRITRPVRPDERAIDREVARLKTPGDRRSRAVMRQKTAELGHRGNGRSQKRAAREIGTGAAKACLDGPAAVGSHPTNRLIHRTAVYGRVGTLVWEGGSRETPTCPDCDLRRQNGFTYSYQIVRRQTVLARRGNDRQNILGDIAQGCLGLWHFAWLACWPAGLRACVGVIVESVQEDHGGASYSN